MQRALAILLFWLTALPATAQLFVGPNLGPAYGRTVEAGLRMYAPSADWLSFSVDGGYTFMGPMYFPRKKAECLSDFRNGGWHMRFGARNGFVTDHHDNHIFWGLDLTLSRQREQATLHSCATSTTNPETVSQSINVVSGGLNFGYSWNPLRKKTIFQRFLIDFGMRVNYPFWSSAPLLGERDYISGVGFTWFPLRSIAFEPIVVFRWELFHRQFGYSKGKTRKRYKKAGY